MNFLRLHFLIKTCPVTRMWENKEFFYEKFRKALWESMNSSKSLRANSKSTKALQQHLQTWFINGLISHITSNYIGIKTNIHRINLIFWFFFLFKCLKTRIARRIFLLIQPYWQSSFLPEISLCLSEHG